MPQASGSRRSLASRFAPIAAATAALALLAGCATTENALKDAEQLMAERDAQRQLPTANITQYSSALNRLGSMLNVYKDGDPVIYLQTRSILDATNLSNPLAGAEIPGDITEMVRTAVNRIGTRIVYVPYHPDYLVSQAQLGAKFGVTMPDFLITGALTEFDRAIGGAGRSNNASIEFGKGKGQTSIGADRKRTAIYSALALDLNLVSFATQQMVPRVQASNVVKVLNLSTEDNASLGFYGDAFGFKLETKYLQGRHSAIRTLVDLSVMELVGKATNTPYWRCIPNGTPDPVVVDNMRASFEQLPPNVKLGLVQVTLRKYGEPVEVTQRFDEPTRNALLKVYGSRFPQVASPVDPLAWAAFEPLFFGVPMPWDPPAEAATPRSIALVEPPPYEPPPAPAAPAPTPARRKPPAVRPAPTSAAPPAQPVAAAPVAQPVAAAPARAAAQQSQPQAAALQPQPTAFRPAAPAGGVTR